MHFRISQVVLTLFMLISSRGYSQTAEDESGYDLPASTEQVQIEVIAFEFPNKGAGSELKTGQTPVQIAGRALAQSGSEGDNFVAIPENQTALAGALARMRASDETRPLVFSAWRQNLSDATWVALSTSEGPGSKIAGRIRMIAGKPLSVQLELNLSNGEAKQYRLRATRPGHFGETLLFDHPALGALVRIAQVRSQ